MVVSKTIKSTNATAALRYILNDTPKVQNETGHRVLAVASQNIDKDYADKIDPLYSAAQFNVIRHSTKKYKLHGKDKKTQVEHLIFSFSDKDFDLSNVTTQAKQALKLVGDYLKERLGPSSQWVGVAQDDNEGHNLHVHVAVNSVNVDGKVFNTNLVRQTLPDGIMNTFNDYLDNHFEQVTGRQFQRVQPQPVRATDTTVSSKERNMKANRSSANSWKDDLKVILDEAMTNNVDMQGFLDQLAANGVTVTEKPHKMGKNADGSVKKRTSYHYLYVDDSGKQHRSVDFAITRRGAIRGLGENYIPDNIQKQLELNAVKQNELSGKSTENDLDSIINDIENGLNDAVSAAVSANAQSNTSKPSMTSIASAEPMVASAANSDEVATSIESVNQRKRRNRQERVNNEFERTDGPRLIMQTVSRTKKPNKEQITKAQNIQKINHNGPSSSSTSSETSSDLEL